MNADPTSCSTQDSQTLDSPSDTTVDTPGMTFSKFTSPSRVVPWLSGASATKSFTTEEPPRNLM